MGDFLVLVVKPRMSLLILAFLICSCLSLHLSMLFDFLASAGAPDRNVSYSDTFISFCSSLFMLEIEVCAIKMEPVSVFQFCQLKVNY